MLICFTSDLHGDRTLYEALGELLLRERPRLLILGGDLLRDADPGDPLGTQVRELREVFLPRIDAWRAAVRDLEVACVVGNHEVRCTRDALLPEHDRGRVVLLDHRRPWMCAGVSFVGHSSTPACPYWVKDFERRDLPGDPVPEYAGAAWDDDQNRSREVDLETWFMSQPSMQEELEMVPAVSSPWILVAHTPPYDSKLDRLLRVPYPIGSRAVRRFIADRQPTVALHGHVHESPQATGSYTDQIGSTLCINPGQEVGRLHAVLFDVRRPVETLWHTVYGDASATGGGAARRSARGG
jgi:Icc-related predicted phosphoesterase